MLVVVEAMVICCQVCLVSSVIQRACGMCSLQQRPLARLAEARIVCWLTSGYL